MSMVYECTKYLVYENLIIEQINQSIIEQTGGPYEMKCNR